MSRRTVILDVAVLTGAGLVIAGCWLIYPPAALIASGIGIMLVVRAVVRGISYDRNRTIR